MKKTFFLFVLIISNIINAQQNATRFYYELTFKPKKDSLKTEKTITILDIADKKSLYRDYSWVSQDSIIKSEMQKMQKSGVYTDMGKFVKWPSFTHKIKKEYPEMKTSFIDGIFQKYFSYVENDKMKWEIEKGTSKILDYKVQKATTNFGGRKWIAWFTNDLEFNDGPYKFNGLPGLILKVEDTDKNYSWVLIGVKKIDDFSELSFTEKVSGFKENVIEIPREKFTKAYSNFKSDPLAEAKNKITPEMMNKKMPGSDLTLGELLKNQEEKLNIFFKSNNNPIEIEKVN